MGISHRHQGDAPPKWADANCRAVLEAAPDAMLVVNRSGEILAANLKAENLFGISREQLIGRVVESLLPVRFRDRHRQHRERFLANPETQFMQVPGIFGVRSDTSEFPADVNLSRLTIGSETFAISAIRDATERIRAEELKTTEAILRQSEERFRLVADTAPVLIWQSGTDKLCTYFNQPWLDFTGRSLDEELGNGWAEGVHPEDLQRCLDTYTQSFDRREKFRMEYRLRRHDGEFRWVLDVGVPRFNLDRSFAGYIGIGVDVTDRKQAEEALRASEERLRLAQQAAGIGAFERNVRTGVVTWSTDLEPMYGLPPGTFDGTTTAFFQNLIHPDDHARITELVDLALKTGRPMTGEWRVLWPDGSIHWIAGRWQVFMDESGEPSRVVGVNMDVTERKRTEEMLFEVNRNLEAQRALLQSREELLKIFVKHVPAAVAMLDRDMRYLQVSERWCSDNSVEASELLGRSRELSPEMPDRWKEVNRRALQGETLRADEDRWESGGSTRWARWEVRPWRAADGTVGGILILTEDITRRKQMEEALSDMSRKLIESQEQERARIGRELHDDITQRLAMLSLELEQLQENPSEVQSRVQELRNQTTELSNDVQAMSHNLHSSKLEYLGVVAGIKSWCKEFGERQRVEIDFSNDVHSALPFEIGRSLFRVLQEALHNATKHSGVKRIEVQLREDSGEIHLIIRDSGKGFDVEAALQGKGLGLTSMRERVRLVNGAISIESKPMGGTVIHVRVPFESEHVSERAV